MTRHIEALLSRPGGEQRKYRFIIRGDSTYCWVQCGKAAPPEGLIFPALLYAGVVSIIRCKDGRIMLYTPDRWEDQHIGIWSRRGTSGAYWGHAWRVTQEGYRLGHWVASWHSSMHGKCNENIEGDPYVIAACWALQAWVDLLADGATVTVRDEEPTLVIKPPGLIYVPADQLPLPKASGNALIGAPSGLPEPPPPPPPDFQNQTTDMEDRETGTHRSDSGEAQCHA